MDQPHENLVDDIGLFPVGPRAAEGLYRIVDAACGRRSFAVSFSLHPSRRACRASLCEATPLFHLLGQGAVRSPRLGGLPHG